MKKILLDCERMKYPDSGLYHFCLQLGHALLQKINNKEAALSFYIPQQAGKIFGNGASYLHQKSLHKFFFPAVKNTDVWHSTYQSSPYHPSSKNIKKILTVHDLNFLYEHAQRSEKIKKSLAKIQSNIDRSDKICAISEFVKNDVEQHLKLNGKKVEVIYNGCNIQKALKLVAPGFIPQPQFIFSLGIVTPKKNLHVLPSLLLNNELQLVIAGVIQQEQYQKKIVEEAKKIGVEKRVVFTGAVSENDKQWYLKNCMAFVFPSIAEGFGLPPIEAMAFGKPVFLSTATSLPEIGGNVAYYFNSFEGNAMRNVFEKGMEHFKKNDPAAAIIKRANSFSWNTAAEKYLELYMNL